ncbi:hypothetical protein [Streptomyces sp. AF1A]|uniref:hypothetical protein n=1 Tax=Streptomyces sp. AF1A TaxID=3394350 RepID=UPI0039BC37AF
MLGITNSERQMAQRPPLLHHKIRLLGREMATTAGEWTGLAFGAEHDNFPAPSEPALPWRESPQLDDDLQPARLSPLGFAPASG